MSIKEQIVSASKDQLVLLETKLNSLLQPIEPRTEFVSSLRHRIQITQNPAIIGRFTSLQFVVITLAGVLSGVVLVTMVARGLVNLLATSRKISE
jgi:hypothetical protein